MGGTGHVSWGQGDGTGHVSWGQGGQAGHVTRDRVGGTAGHVSWGHGGWDRQLLLKQPATVSEKRT